MKAMNEFESVLAIAALILAVCATMDIPLAGPNAASGRSGSDYAGSRVMPSLEVVKPANPDITAGGTAADPLAMASLEADRSPRYAPAMLVHPSRQKRASW